MVFFKCLFRLFVIIEHHLGVLSTIVGQGVLYPLFLYLQIILSPVHAVDYSSLSLFIDVDLTCQSYQERGVF